MQLIGKNIELGVFDIGDVLGIQLGRDGSHANDTYDVDWKVAALQAIFQ